MKIGAGFNVFSGGEFLKPTLLNIREQADFIVVMYQLVSITATKAPHYLMPLLKQLKSEGLVDKLIECKPNIFNTGIKVQDAKRIKYEIGRQECIRQGCTHFMLRDCDEFYDPQQLEATLSNLQNYDLVLAPIYDYVKTPLLRAKDINTLHVPAIHDIRCKYQSRKFSVLLDLGRTVLAENPKICNRNELAMHHFTGVRFNLREMQRKFEGHSHFINQGKQGQEKYLADIENTLETRYKKVDDIFGIQAYWDNEFREFYERYEGK